MADRDPAADLLEPPVIAVRVLAWIGLGALVFIAVATFGLGLFYRGIIGERPHPSIRPFPQPRLETSIDPRTVPAEGPGPAQATPPAPAQFDPPTLQRAIQIVAAQGARAYDPPAEASR